MLPSERPRKSPIVGTPSDRVIGWTDAAQVLGIASVPARPYERDDYLYFAQAATGHIKVGCSWKPVSRVQQLNEPRQQRELAKRVGLELPRIFLRLVVSGCHFGHERAMHDHFGSERVAREWFYGPRVEEELQKLLNRSVAFADLAPDWPHQPCRGVQWTGAANPPASNLLVAWRERRGLTTAQAARVLRVLEPALQQYEVGIKLPSDPTAARIHEATGGAVPLTSWTRRAA